MERKPIVMDMFQPRDYQLPLINALEVDGYKRIIAVMPRRSGKDLTAFNMIIWQAIQRVGVYYCIYPEYSQGRKILWDSIDNDGRRFLDYIPSQLVASTNSQMMQIRMINGSLVQVIGSDNYNSLVGTNPVGIMLSEYAVQDPMCYNFLRPILLGNSGFAIFVSTPRGRNHMRDLWDIAENSDNWFTYHLTVDQTKHISVEAIEDEIARGEMSRDLALQEYWCSWDFGVEGAYYTKYIDKLKLNGQIGDVVWDPNLKVHCAFDLGMRDKTCLVMWQNGRDGSIRIIDSYSNSDVGLEHYAKYLHAKDYDWGKFFAPHDIAVRELGTGLSRLERSRQLGINFVVAPRLSLEDGIEAVRAKLPLMWFDKNKAAPVIKALENYRKEYDSKLKVYKNHPLHDESSHFADAVRYMSICLPKSQDGISSEALDKRYRQAMGYTDREPSFFDNNFNYPSGGGMGGF